jgi:hypothetical protein
MKIIVHKIHVPFFAFPTGVGSTRQFAKPSFAVLAFFCGAEFPWTSKACVHKLFPAPENVPAKPSDAGQCTPQTLLQRVTVQTDNSTQAVQNLLDSICVVTPRLTQGFFVDKVFYGPCHEVFGFRVFCAL